VAGVLVAAIAVTLLALLVNFIGGLVHPIVGSVLALVIFLGFAAVLLVVLAGGAYLAWRDTFDTPQARTPGFTGIEA